MPQLPTSASAVNPALPTNVRVATPLATGGQGVVFKGTVDGTPAAIKLYLPNQFEVRVDREIAALGRLSCRTIAPLLWSGEVQIGADSVRVVATKLVNGTPLNELLRQRTLTDAELGALLYDVSDAVRNLWGIRVVHRDLKPSNIIMESGRAVVIDLGVARHLDQATITMAGATWGTLGYMSPEQTRGVKQLTCKSDLFALGIIALESRLQRHPTNGDQLRLLAARLHEALPSTLTGIPHESLIRSLLAPRPTGRPPVEQVLSELSALATS